jgi:hypothetical protein
MHFIPPTMLHVLTISYGYGLIPDRRSNGCQNVSLTLCENKLCPETREWKNTNYYINTTFYIAPK